MKHYEEVEGHPEQGMFSVVPDLPLKTLLHSQPYGFNKT